MKILAKRHVSNPFLTDHNERKSNVLLFYIGTVCRIIGRIKKCTWNSNGHT